MKRLVLGILLLLSAMAAWADETWLGIYIQGSKIGYSTARTEPAKLDGKPVTKNISRSVFNGKMLGTDFEMEVDSVSYLDGNGKLIQSRITTASAGRKQVIEATFAAGKVAVKIDNNGTKSTKELIVPKGASVQDDPMNLVLTGAGGFSQGTIEALVLDPLTATLVKNTVRYAGKVKVEVAGAEYTADMVEIQDPRALTKVYLSGKGDLIKIAGPMGMEMFPEPRTVATALGTGRKVDLASASRIPLDKPIENPNALKRLKVEVTGFDLTRMPSDEHQTVTKNGSAWVVEVHPVGQSLIRPFTIDAAAKAKPEWVQPEPNIPCDTSAFRQLATSVIKGKTDVLEAARTIQDYVGNLIKPNTGIAIIRNANEVLASKEGLCRDHAVLSATIMRAARIPTRLASGLIYDDGAFYYHAWVEVWSGSQWVGFDSTRPGMGVGATHWKIAQGKLDDAFMFFVLDGAKLKLLDVLY